MVSPKIKPTHLGPFFLAGHAWKLSVRRLKTKENSKFLDTGGRDNIEIEIYREWVVGGKALEMVRS